jgi:polysaccharide export outer membrane protein
MFVQLHNRHSDLQQEQAKLSAEFGPTYPRVVEIQHQIADIDAQIQAENAHLLERFHSAWQTAQGREALVRSQLNERTQAGLAQNQATTQYALMQLEARSSGELLTHVSSRLEEGGLAAGIHSSSITLVDPAYEPYQAVAPDIPLYMAITFFVGLWLALGIALLMDSLAVSQEKSTGTKTLPAILLLAVGMTFCLHAKAQAPTPSTQGIPAGVTQPILPSKEQRPLPNPKEAPAVWNALAGVTGQNTTQSPGLTIEAPLAAPLSPGDAIDVSEFHTPEFHTIAHVAPDGTVSLPLLRAVKVVGLDEQAAARAIEKALVEAGILLHPQVSVMVTAYAGQDVSVLGEVARPGVYAFTVHHRLLDLISAAQGLSPTAGRLVNIFHRNDPQTPHPVALDLSGSDSKQDHNPELEPGDTVQVSRAGLVYVIGDVVRPGGFPVDPVQGLTVVQAISLAWGPTMNAASGKAILIREQKGGRTLTTLNLKRMLHGQEPDIPIHDRDILFVPDSTAKGMLNRTIGAAIQSAVGVSIYAGLVYSQRF